jgi:hypothetical protein
MNNEHEETRKDRREDGDNLGEDNSRGEEMPRFLQVGAREYLHDYANESSQPPYYYEGEVIHERRDGHYDPVRVRIGELTDKQTVLSILRCIQDWIDLNWDRLTEGEEALNSFNGEWYDLSGVFEEEEEQSRYLRDDDEYQSHVYEVRDDAGGYDEFQDDKTVAIYAGWEEAKEHAKQIGGYVREVTESRHEKCDTSERWSTRKVVMDDNLMWDWVNDDLFEGMAHLEKRVFEIGDLGPEDIRGELFNLEDMLDDGELDDTEDIRQRIKILEYWYSDRILNVVGR